MVPLRRPLFASARSGVRSAARQPLGVLALLLLIGIALAAVSAPWIVPFDPTEQHYDALLRPPGVPYLFGTDDFGRDVLSRLISGARVSLSVALLSIGIGHTFGALLGLIGGYFGGWPDLWVQRLMDAMMAFPVLVLALAVVAVTGPSLTNVTLAIAVVEIPRASRVIRSSTLAIREHLFIESARAVGAGHARIVFRHVLPSCVPAYLVLASVGLGHAIIVEASLSFLGLGVPPPAPTWGGMLSGSAQKYAVQAPWMVIAPGLAISLLVYAFNLLGDAMRDVMDPRQRGLL
jgi:peptide/nickel transport system permease protein